jgi:hypothetical protein
MVGPANLRPLFFSIQFHLANFASRKTNLGGSEFNAKNENQAVPQQRLPHLVYHHTAVATV